MKRAEREKEERCLHACVLIQLKRQDRKHEHGMKGTMSDYEVEKIEETKLVEIYRNN